MAIDVRRGLDRFREKRAVITGAGGGLGRCLALELAQEGWRLALADVNTEGCEETAHLVEQRGGRAFAERCDVTRAEQVERLATMVDERFAGLDMLFNNAGVAGAGAMDSIPLEDWDWIFAVNFMGAVHGCRAFIPLLERQGGHIVNVASMAGLLSVPESSAYNASKAALVSLSETLRVELAPRNISLTLAVPMFFQTNLLSTFRSTDRSQLETARAMMASASITAEDVARKILAGVARDRMFVVTEPVGAVSWGFKRWFPRVHFWLWRHLHLKGFFDRSESA